MSKPFYFREAIVFDVDPKNLTCDLIYGDLTMGEMSHGVPMPNLAGAGNSGVIANLKRGTRVIAAYLHDASKETVVIVSVLPSNFQKQSNYNEASEYVIDKANGTLPYPGTLADGDVYLSAHTGPRVWMRSNNSLYISTMEGRGLFAMPGPDNSHNLFYLSNNHSMEGSGGRLSWGRVKRSGDYAQWSTIRDSNTDILRDGKLRDIGFWIADPISHISTNVSKRNASLSEYKMIINEFSTEFGFSGFDKELEKYSNSEIAMQKDPTLLRDRESTNSLRLGEGELIEIIGGNLVDIDGLILDLNYRPIDYGLEFPNVDTNLKLEEAFRKSRRGIGYHFKLSTNSRSFDRTSSLKDFIFDIDKEGVLKVNIPMSTSTGNIPYVNNVDFTSESNPRRLKVLPALETKREKIPVNLRNRDGEIVDDKPPGTPNRETGIRFENLANDSYFSSNSDSANKTVRVNTTKHHNIYAAAERLIANQIKKVHIPVVFFKEKSSGGGPDISDDPALYSNGSSFEVRYKEPKDGATKSNNITDVDNLLYSAVQVGPAAPAISTGGDTFVAGISYNQDDKRQPVISNYFKTSEGDDGVRVTSSNNFENIITHGGVSANINLEGSLELSVGKDNVDNKSIVLDTAGSLIAWLGKDKLGRSAIIQSDGEVLVNIGGSYTSSSNPNEKATFNPGRFDLRVNVVDKGFYDSKSSRSKSGSRIEDDSPYSSDYIISISENGLVISGMKAGAPMIIRNDGPLMMESASSKLTLKGMQVEVVEFARPPTDDGRSRK